VNQIALDVSEDIPSTGPVDSRSARWWRMPTLADRFDGRGNAIGLLRHLLAFSVLVAHSWQLGYNVVNPTGHLWSHQTELGGMGVFGFFVLSGFLITGSGLKFSIGRFAWHRFLRIYPGLWACLAFCAFVLAPLLAIAQGRGLRAFWTAPDGPTQYFTRNFFASIQQSTISGLLADTPFGNGHPTSFNGPLWSLSFELLCYVGVGVLAVLAVLRRAPYVVPMLTGVVWAALISHALRGRGPTAPMPFQGSVGPVPLLGAFGLHDLIILGFLFLLGATIQLYKHRLPMHGSLAIVAAAVLAASLWFGGFLVVGIPAYAYLLLYVAVASPRRLHSVGRRWDYSYGIYIYAYPVQMVVALLGVPRFGVVPYIALSAIGAMALAMASWHLVEKPAMRMKDLLLVRPGAATTSQA
jgi:peptidoglycan/LPS O-acetylase OafA/YrhL